MPVLEHYFHSAELGRRWTAPEGVLPSSPGGRPGCQQGPLPWDLPEMIRMVKLVWKSKSELQATRQRGIPESEDALHSFPGDVRLRGQTGVPAERRGSYPFIDFRLLNRLFGSLFFL
uniref:Phosphodiesterase 7B n=1 Tax=Pipistrellus kuhlii TaxID=59472 RepID=A0A7J7YN18_PIPKU|nr:phosphodiesterase 7B [Pipistrellus kuhlii]